MYVHDAHVCAWSLAWDNYTIAKFSVLMCLSVRYLGNRKLVSWAPKDHHPSPAHLLQSDVITK